MKVAESGRKWLEKVKTALKRLTMAGKGWKSMEMNGKAGNYTKMQIGSENAKYD